MIEQIAHRTEDVHRDRAPLCLRATSAAAVATSALRADMAVTNRRVTPSVAAPAAKNTR